VFVKPSRGDNCAFPYDAQSASGMMIREFYVACAMIGLLAHRGAEVGVSGVGPPARTMEIVWLANKMADMALAYGKEEK
jgi:hypothetical protein